MFQQKKVIISCAVTGAIHTPSMSPYLPVTAEEIAEASIAAVEAGAAIIHLHSPSIAPCLYVRQSSLKFLRRISQNYKVVSIE